MGEGVALCKVKAPLHVRLALTSRAEWTRNSLKPVTTRQDHDAAGGVLLLKTSDGDADAVLIIPVLRLCVISTWG
jgi:hypothetical protein